jgi:hypothetical protein
MDDDDEATGAASATEAEADERVADERAVEERTAEEREEREAVTPGTVYARTRKRQEPVA